jgi:hypothetical protein
MHGSADYRRFDSGDTQAAMMPRYRRRRRMIAPTQPVMMNVLDMLKLEVEPIADCSRYDRLRGCPIHPVVPSALIALAHLNALHLYGMAIA